MRLASLFTLPFAVLLLSAAPAGENKEYCELPPWMTTSFKTMEGKETTLAKAFPGKAVVVVNTASRCGFTPQYADLEEVHREYGPKGVAVVAFPSNDYGNQEPGTNEEILEFCQENYGVTFPVMAKMHTRGEDISQLYKHLTGEDSIEPGEVQWNFEKFILAADGEMIARFRSRTSPASEEFREAVERAAATAEPPTSEGEEEAEAATGE